jgi:hypothetical protein
VDVAAERPGTVGLTHMLEHHLFKGSDVSAPFDWEAERAIAERVERLEREITDEENREPRLLPAARRVRGGGGSTAARRGSTRCARSWTPRRPRRTGWPTPTWYDWAVQGAGGTNSTASTGRDWMKFDIDLPANKLELFMWTERSRLEHPVFRHFEPEKEVVVDQIRRYDNRPDGPFARVLRSMTYDAHPYGWAHWFSDLTRATREDHWEIFHKYFIPQNTIVIVVVGEVKAEDVVPDGGSAYWGSWQQGRPSPRLRTVEPAARRAETSCCVEAAAPVRPSRSTCPCRPWGTRTRPWFEVWPSCSAGRRYVRAAGSRRHAGLWRGAGAVAAAAGGRRAGHGHRPDPRARERPGRTRQ